MLSGVITDFKMGVTMPMYMGEDKAPIMATIEAKAPAFVAYLGQNKFLAGNDPTYVDFYFFELLEALNWATDGSILTTYPTFKTYHASFLALPGMTAANNAEKGLTFNNKSAK